MKNILKQLAKSILMSLGLTAAALAADSAIPLNFLASGMAALIFSNAEMDYIMKIVKSLEDSDLLIKNVNETIKDESKKQRGRFLSILLSTLGAILLDNLLTGKRVKAKIQVQRIIKANEVTTATSWGQGMIRAGQDF